MFANEMDDKPPQLERTVSLKEDKRHPEAGIAAHPAIGAADLQDRGSYDMAKLTKLDKQWRKLTCLCHEEATYRRESKHL